MSVFPLMGLLVLALPMGAAIAIILVAKALGTSASESASCLRVVLDALLRRQQ